MQDLIAPVKKNYRKITFFQHAANSILN